MMPHARAAVDFFNTTAFGWHVGLMLLSARCLIVVNTVKSAKDIIYTPPPNTLCLGRSRR